MVMAANWVAIRRRFDAKLIYVPLIASLLVLILVPRGVDSGAALGWASGVDATGCPASYLLRGAGVLDHVQA